MKPGIDMTSFGSITISGETYDHDVVIDLQGEVKKRKKNFQRKNTELLIWFPLKKQNVLWIKVPPAVLLLSQENLPNHDHPPAGGHKTGQCT